MRLPRLGVQEILRSRVLLVVLPVILVVAVVGAIVVATQGSSSAKSKVSGGSSKVLPASFAVPYVQGAKISYKHHLTFKVANGAITTVSAKANGRTIAGSYDATHSKWRSTSTLGPLEKIAASVTYANLAHAMTTKTISLHTADSKHHFSAILSPAAGAKVGIATPVIVQFSQDVPHSRRAAVERHLSVTSKPAVVGAWHWMSDREVHWRPPTYWKRRTKVTIHSDLQDVSIGHDTWGIQGAHATSFKIGASHISEVDQATHQMKVYDDGKLIKTLPVSTGREQYPTMDGVHVTLDKEPVVQMNSATVGIPKGSPGYYNETVYWDVRISNSGEYVHAAPWSVGSQGFNNVSHGCVNVSTENAEWFYNWAQIGDVVDVYNGVRPPLSYDAGTEDWNMSWKAWLKGGAAPSAAAKAVKAPKTLHSTEPGFTTHDKKAKAHKKALAKKRAEKKHAKANKKRAKKG